MPTSIANEERVKREHEEYISLIEKLLAINSFPHPLENFHANTIVETLHTSPILVEDSDSLREEIDIFTGTDDLLPLGIESDDYDLEGDIHFLEELLVNDSVPLSKNESSDFDHHDDPLFPRPPLEPPDVEFFFEPNSGEVISAVINNINEFNEDERFDPGGEVDVFENIEDDDYFPFIFVIQFFLSFRNEDLDNRTMAQNLQPPIEGYEDAIVVPQINTNNFELKRTLINLVQSNQFTGRQDPHNHLRFFNKVTSTFRHPEVPNTTVKLLLFPFSLEGEARIWLDKEPPRSILTWEDLVSKFINQFFPPSKTTYLRNEITNFLQKSNETFNEAWERFKDLLRQCPHHGFSELHQLDTFYNALNPNDQDALDSAAGGNFLDKIPHE
nr:reverse transcriptase domain-containing protein [Tanacetum cinerariifolium]